MIQLQKITKKYYTKEVITTAVNEIDLTVEQGEFISIMGPSGCGKTTLLNVMGFLDGFDDGDYRYNNKEVASITSRERAEIAKTDFGFVFQNFNLIDSYTVAKNVELPLLYSGVSAKDRQRMVQETLKYVELDHRGSHKPNQLSGGQQQRVAVARALVKAPKIIFADEPTGNLDSTSGLIVMDMLKRFNEEQGTTVIMVSHSEEFAKYGHRILHLFDGSIVSESDPKFYT